jgi:hypothetical protein
MENPDGSWNLTLRDAQHAASDGEFKIKVKYDSMGHIMSLTIVEPEVLQQSAIGALPEDIEFLEHYGVKGMKWGVRRRGRIDRTVRVGKGEGSKLDKVRVHGMFNPVDLVKTGGSFRESAARKGKRMANRNNRIARGKASVVDYLITSGTARMTDILPSVRRKALDADQKSNLRKVSSGKEFLMALPTQLVPSPI